jgi:nicotinic acid mononucleotide adenylyltransferase
VYNISNEHRIALCEQFVREIWDDRVILDTEFITWDREMITKDVDQYVQDTYGPCIHIFGTDTIASMPDWDEEWYAAREISKIFIPRKGYDSNVPDSIEQYSVFKDSHFPDISSTSIRQEIRNEYYKHIHHSKDFTFSWLSKSISSYILSQRLY